MATVIDRRNLALLALGGVSLLAGLTGALVLLGWDVPSSASALAGGHGLLMAIGFLGTMIALERAVALGAWWGFLSPLAAGVGAMALVAGAPSVVVGVLLFIGGAVLVAMYVAFDRIAVALHTRVQALGALAWPVAILLWLNSRPISEIVPWLAAFLILIIAGERLELSRVVQLGTRVRVSFMAGVALLYSGVVLSLPFHDLGWRIAGLGLVALATWFGLHDVARRTVRTSGVTRYIAVCLLAGYGWLAAAGLLWIGFGATLGASYDAMLHAIFLGFVMSMVFGHAPIIIPAVLRVPLPYHPRFYLHVVLLHAGLAVRVIGGDLFGSQAMWETGGVLNVVALLLFVLSSVGAVVPELVRRRQQVVVHRGAKERYSQ
jgi:hypothetical protein